MHHSVNMKEFNSNFSSVLPVWDRLFKTFTQWDDTRLVKIGLPIYREEKWQEPMGMLALPLKGLDR